MKKQLLSLFLLLFIFAAEAQNFQPEDISVCTYNEVAYVDLSASINNMWGDFSPADFNVSYHTTLSDANLEMNPLVDFADFPVYVNTTIYVRVENIEDGTSQVVSYLITANFAPPVDLNLGWDVCDVDNDPSDGTTYIDLGSVAENIWSTVGSNPNNLLVTFHEAQSEALTGSNPVSYSGYFNFTPFNQIIYVRTEYSTTGCFTISELTLFVSDCNSICPVPSFMGIMDVTATTAVLNFTPADGTSTELFITAEASPGPSGNMSGLPAVAPYVFTGLSCEEVYKVYSRSICTDGSFSSWTGPLVFEVDDCAQSGLPQNLSICSEAGEACFDLASNNINIIGTLDPSQFTISYFTSYDDAMQDTEVIQSDILYCLPTPVLEVPIFTRLENIATGTAEVFQFFLNTQETMAANMNLTPLVVCDEDNNGVVEFQLTDVVAQLQTINQLTYYATSADAGAENNPISNPNQFLVSIDDTITTVFIRETVIGGCDSIYTLVLNALGTCTTSNVCNGAYSLCNALGIAFENTSNVPGAEPGNDYGCLGSQPNPTWFFIPISTAGNLSLSIEQSVTPNFTSQGLDVDFIAYGPFSEPVTPCSGLLTAENIVDCSYSTATQEIVTIPSAQPGEFYLIMVTNFSGQQGYIRITQTSGGTGEINCTGIRLNAFLDSNNNGEKDSGESNFPLGQFNYEKNDNGTVHHITTSNGVYNLYDISNTASYDVGFTIDPSYSANYTLSTSQYSDISVIANAGMQEFLFPVTVTNSYDDLSVTIVPDQSPRPGFTYTNTILYSNLGSTPVSGTVTFMHDPNVSIVANTQAGIVNTTSGFSYNFTNLAPFEERSITVTMQVPTIPTVALGDLLTNSADINPVAGDVAPENNSTVSVQEVIGSYDPNDKVESRGESILITDFTDDDYLYYTVRFENTGTASAINVNIVDVLDAGLDASSVKMVGASHDYVLDRVEEQLNWKFEDIMLPAASTDPAGAKGYVQFKVKPLPGYAVGDMISNTAHIYFDFNPAIVTNTFTSTFVQQLGTEEVSLASFTIYPNPANDQVFVTADSNIEKVTIYDLLGKTVLNTVVNGNSTAVDVSGVSSGLYLLEVSNGNMKQVGKLVIE